MPSRHELLPIAVDQQLYDSITIPVPLFDPWNLKSASFGNRRENKPLSGCQTGNSGSGLGYAAARANRFFSGFSVAF
jgi:hypothetical protein